MFIISIMPIVFSSFTKNTDKKINIPINPSDNAVNSTREAVGAYIIRNKTKNEDTYRRSLQPNIAIQKNNSDKNIGKTDKKENTRIIPPDNTVKSLGGTINSSNIRTKSTNDGKSAVKDMGKKIPIELPLNQQAKIAEDFPIRKVISQTLVSDNFEVCLEQCRRFEGKIDCDFKIINRGTTKYIKLFDAWPFGLWFIDDKLKQIACDVIKYESSTPGVEFYDLSKSYSDLSGIGMRSFLLKKGSSVHIKIISNDVAPLGKAYRNSFNISLLASEKLISDGANEEYVDIVFKNIHILN